VGNLARRIEWFEAKAFQIESGGFRGEFLVPDQTVAALLSFVNCDDLSVSGLVAYTQAVCPDSTLRTEKGQDVRVAGCRVEPGGPSVVPQLAGIIERMRCLEHPFYVHADYLLLHPFSDGNGRSSRALWLWGMVRRREKWQRDQAIELGFLVTWYYQSLRHFHTIRSVENGSLGTSTRSDIEGE
jgi:hypothetical protein